MSDLLGHMVVHRKSWGFSIWVLISGLILLRNTAGMSATLLWLNRHEVAHECWVDPCTKHHDTGWCFFSESLCRLMKESPIYEG